MQNGGHGKYSQLRIDTSVTLKKKKKYLYRLYMLLLYNSHILIIHQRPQGTLHACMKSNKSMITKKRRSSRELRSVQKNILFRGKLQKKRVNLVLPSHQIESFRSSRLSRSKKKGVVSSRKKSTACQAYILTMVWPKLNEKKNWKVWFQLWVSWVYAGLITEQE
jgi:hypothetical protein